MPGFKKVRYKTGSVRRVPAYIAERLIARGIAVDASAPVEGPQAPLVEEAQGPEATPEPSPGGPVGSASETPEIDLDAMTRDELYNLAVARGLEVHPQLGAKKLKALLQ